MAARKIVRCLETEVRVQNKFFLATFSNAYGLFVAGGQADLQVYFAMDVGHGKGLLVNDIELRFGWGMRVVLFKSGLGAGPPKGGPRR